MIATTFALALAVSIGHAAQVVAVLGRNVPAMNQTSATTPCDLVSGCVGAHSINRKVVAAYSGKLFQLSRTGGGGGTQDIGFMPATGAVDTAAIATFCGSSWPMSNGAGANSCAFHIIYDQSGNGNNLTTCPTCTDLPFSSNPVNNNVWAQTGNAASQFLNIDFATNAPSGTADKSVVVVANDTNTANSACGIYGMYHRVADPSTTGTDFAIDMRSGIQGIPVRVMGTDLEQDVIEVAYGYGATDFATNLQTPRDYVGIATATNTATPIVVNYNGIYSYSHNYVPSSSTFNTGASFRMGAGGDGCASGGIWYEGLIYNSAISSTSQSTLLTNMQTYYGISTSPTCTEGGTSQSINHFATVTGTWGLRKMDPGGMTPIGILERASDSTTQIINSSGCDFDVSTASTFCASTTCHVMLLANQAPWPAFGHQDLYTTAITCNFCTNYLENGTLSSTPTLTFNCIGSKVCMTYTGTSLWMQTHNNQSVTRPYSVFGVSNRTSGNTSGEVLGTAGNAMFLGGGAANLMLFQASTSGGQTVTASDSAWHATAGTVPTNTSIEACVDGTCTLNNSATTVDISNLQYGIAFGSGGWVGTVTEVALAPSAISTTTVASIQSAQKAYWGY